MLKKRNTLSLRNIFLFIVFFSLTIFLVAMKRVRTNDVLSLVTNDTLEFSFVTPPATVRPGVFWQWEGGNISKEGLTKDLEAMAAQGVGAVMVMQMPDQEPYPKRWDFREYPGKVRILSDEWFALVNHAIGEADRLGITYSMFFSSGWSHAGGPWVTPRRGLKKLMVEKVEVQGPVQFNKVIPRAPRSVGQGGGNETPSWFVVPPDQKFPEQPDFYQDVAVIAVPSLDKKEAIPINKILELTDKFNNGKLDWKVPAGSWTIMRMGVASENGVNHPAPFEATGLESDRMDPEAVRIVYDGMIGRIIREAKFKGYHSFKAFETDSYEAGFQDFGLDFREQFRKRRGYDCILWLAAWLDKNLIIGDREVTQRFRNDMTRTISELMDERFYGKLRSLADENNVEWMIEPYFRLNIDWRTAGARSTLSGSEFWIGKPFGYIGPAPDIAALYGLPVVWAEAFTAESYTSAWRNDPLILKPWGDAVFCRGVNQFYMHGFAHNPFSDQIQPGFTMGYWGTQFDRHITWWSYSASWHRYLSRCQFMLRQGHPVNDVLAYPAKIQPVPSKVLDAGPFRQVVLNDEALLERLWVRDDGRIGVKGGGDFAAIALTPGVDLRPEALHKIKDMVQAGATLIGIEPKAISSSLENYPACDKEMSALIHELWGGKGTGEFNEHAFGKGHVLATSELTDALNKMAGGPDVQFFNKAGNGTIKLKGSEETPFNIMADQILILSEPSNQVNAMSDGVFKSMDFVHRRDGNIDIYFVCNTGDKPVELLVDFRISGKLPEQWDAVTGKFGVPSGWQQKNGRTKVAMQFAPRQSFFVVFRKPTTLPSGGSLQSSTRSAKTIKAFTGDWDVSFDPRWGGPEKIVFNNLEDWSKRTEKGIRYYSGTAAYQKQFDLSGIPSSSLYIDIGEVHNLARVTLNGSDLGILWCAPWRVEVPAGLLKKKDNLLKIDVVNTWVNRLIGDEQEPEDCELIDWNPDTNRKGSYDFNLGSRGLKDLPDWVINGGERPSKGRYTFTTWRFYDKNAPLQPSGLLGPVKLVGISEK